MPTGFLMALTNAEMESLLDQNSATMETQEMATDVINPARSKQIGSALEARVRAHTIQMETEFRIIPTTVRTLPIHPRRMVTGTQMAMPVTTARGMVRKLRQAPVGVPHLIRTPMVMAL
jgi:hypothetical protein